MEMLEHVQRRETELGKVLEHESDEEQLKGVGAGHVFGPSHLHNASSFLAAGVSVLYTVTGRASGTAVLVAPLLWEATGTSHQLHPAVLQTQLPGAPHHPSVSPNRPHPSAQEQPLLCISISHLSQRDQVLFPKGSGFEGFILLAIILSPTSQLVCGCHSAHSIPLSPGTLQRLLQLPSLEGFSVGLDGAWNNPVQWKVSVPMIPPNSTIL